MKGSHEDNDLRKGCLRNEGEPQEAREKQEENRGTDRAKLERRACAATANLSRGAKAARKDDNQDPVTSPARTA